MQQDQPKMSDEEGGWNSVPKKPGREHVRNNPWWVRKQWMDQPSHHWVHHNQYPAIVQGLSGIEQA